MDTVPYGYGLKNTAHVARARYRTNADASGNGADTCKPDLPLGEPAGDGVEREFFSKTMGKIESKIDGASGMRVSVRTEGVSGRMLPSAYTSHSVRMVAYGARCARI